MCYNHCVEQIELQAKLLNYFLGSNKSNINQSKDNDYFNFSYSPRQKTASTHATENYIISRMVMKAIIVTEKE